MVVWINRLVQVASTLAVGWYLFVQFRGPGAPTWAFVLVVCSVLVSVATQLLVLRAERAGRPHDGVPVG